jgi:hypothetical protein
MMLGKTPELIPEIGPIMVWADIVDGASVCTSIMPAKRAAAKSV